MTEHGTHAVHPAYRLWRQCVQYPWSILWVLGTAGLASLVAGAYVPVAIIVIMQAIITVHSIRTDRIAARKKE